MSGRKGVNRIKAEKGNEIKQRTKEWCKGNKGLVGEIERVK